jgi:diaminopimelate epimerase
MMCGNGGRCSVYYYYKYFSDNKRRFHFLMNGRPYEGRMTKSIVYIYFPTPFARAFRHKIQTEIGEFESIFIDVGTPHECIEVSNIDTVDMKYLGPLIRKEAEHKPEGANVSFYQQQSPTKVLIRTYERGLECESNACGSGAVAVGSILVDRQGYQGQITFVPTSKEILVIEVEAYQAPKRDGTRPVRNIILGGFVKEL